MLLRTAALYLCIFTVTWSPPSPDPILWPARRRCAGTSAGV
jgi:hypothetical protein